MQLYYTTQNKEHYTEKTLAKVITLKHNNNVIVNDGVMLYNRPIPVRQYITRGMDDDGFHN